MINIDLSNKNAVVLGVSDESSIAWSVAKKLKEAGSGVYIGYRHTSRDSAERLAAGIDCFAGQCDVTDAQSMGEFFKEVKRKFGSIDYLVHSVAFAKKSDLERGLTDLSRESFERTMDVSAYSLVEVVRRAKPIITNGGSIVSMSYLGSERVVSGYAPMGPAKAALEAITRYLASELGEKGIRVNCVSPGPIDTKASTGVPRFSEIRENVGSIAPLGNPTQEDVANAVLFLCLPLSRNITGQVLYVDGGYNIMGPSPDIGRIVQR